ncbi:hypothetical protein MP228_009106 [Amoeboaphelidium protococcarum]|nr:hypothetical protein MP228_009106 [Amoeboaphelidium protococcarum]
MKQNRVIAKAKSPASRRSATLRKQSSITSSSSPVSNSELKQSLREFTESSPNLLLLPSSTETSPDRDYNGKDSVVVNVVEKTTVSRRLSVQTTPLKQGVNPVDNNVHAPTSPVLKETKLLGKYLGQSEPNLTQRQDSLVGKQSSGDREVEGQKPSDTTSQNQSIISLFKTLAGKKYFSGWLYKCNDLQPDGEASSDQQWHLFYVEVIGTALKLFKATPNMTIEVGKLCMLAKQKALDEKLSQFEAELTRSTTPVYIRLNDGKVKFLGLYRQKHNKNPFLVGYFCISSAGVNRYLLQTLPQRESQSSNWQDAFTYQLSVTWINILILGQFEEMMLNNAFTNHFLQSRLDLRVIEDSIQHELKTTGGLQMEGWLQARLAGSTDWKEYYCVLDRQMSPYPSQMGSLQIRGRLNFYLSQKDAEKAGKVGDKSKTLFSKKRSPQKYACFELSDIYDAHIVYPEKEQLIQLNTLFKVHGGSYSIGGQGKDVFQCQVPLNKDGLGERVDANTTKSDSDGVVIANFTLFLAKTQTEMVRWLYAIWMAFGLHGRQSKTRTMKISSQIDDADLIDQLCDPKQLYLLPQDLQNVNLSRNEQEQNVKFLKDLLFEKANNAAVTDNSERFQPPLDLKIEALKQMTPSVSIDSPDSSASSEVSDFTIKSHHKRSRMAVGLNRLSSPLSAMTMTSTEAEDSALSSTQSQDHEDESEDQFEQPKNKKFFQETTSELLMKIDNFPDGAQATSRLSQTFSANTFISDQSVSPGVPEIFQVGESIVESEQTEEEVVVIQEQPTVELPLNVDVQAEQIASKEDSDASKEKIEKQEIESVVDEEEHFRRRIVSRQSVSKKSKSKSSSKRYSKSVRSRAKSTVGRIQSDVSEEDVKSVLFEIENERLLISQEREQMRKELEDLRQERQRYTTAMSEVGGYAASTVFNPSYYAPSTTGYMYPQQQQPQYPIFQQQPPPIQMPQFTGSFVPKMPPVPEKLSSPTPSESASVANLPLAFSAMSMAQPAMSSTGAPSMTGVGQGLVQPSQKVQPQISGLVASIAGKTQNRSATYDPRVGQVVGIGSRPPQQQVMQPGVAFAGGNRMSFMPQQNPNGYGTLPGGFQFAQQLPQVTSYAAQYQQPMAQPQFRPQYAPVYQQPQMAYPQPAPQVYGQQMPLYQTQNRASYIQQPTQSNLPVSYAQLNGVGQQQSAGQKQVNSQQNRQSMASSGYDSSSTDMSAPKVDLRQIPQKKAPQAGKQAVKKQK